MQDVEIDIGRFKYVLLRVASRESPVSKLVVRGDRSKAYHADILEAVRTDLQAYNLKVCTLDSSEELFILKEAAIVKSACPVTCALSAWQGRVQQTGTCTDWGGSCAG